MNRIRKLLAVLLSVAIIASVCVISGSFSAGASGTGAGLAEYCLGAYYDGWSYVWGGTTPGAVDCSGLIWSYCGGNRTSMLSDAQANGRDWGYVSSGVPRVHGLGLSRPNHVGVYIEDGMEVDARGSDYGVCYQAIGGWNNWDCWFKLTAVSYPTTGWEKFNGNYYYYENGEYIVDTSRTIDGTTYYFDSKGHSSTTPSSTSSESSSTEEKSTKADSTETTEKASQSSAPTKWQKGSNDEEVVKIQTRLAELGYYNGAIDGDFGDATDAAFRAFQKAAGLTVDGIAGSDREILYSDNAPYAKTEEPATEAVQETTEAEAVEETTAPAEETTVQAETEEANFVLVQNGDFSDSVATIQTKLAELGYFGLEPTGLYGDYTEQAVMEFQIANGLEATGIIDTQTYELLYSEDAVANPVPAEAEEEEPDVENETEAEETAEEAPANAEAETENEAKEDVSYTETKLYDIAATTRDYAATAANSVAKANELTEKALEKASAAVPNAKTAEVKRSANIWIWFVLVAIILGVAAVILLVRDRKQTRYQRYAAKKKKTSARAQLNARW